MSTNAAIQIAPPLPGAPGGGSGEAAPASEREQFLARRRRGIGGSDLHHVMNEAPYGCARWLAYDKLGVEPDYGRDNERILRRGTRLEEVVAEEYAEATGRKVRRMPTRIDRQHPWRAVNVDRQILCDGRGPGALECKTASEHVFRAMKREGLPAAYVLQLQWALAVTGYTWGAFAVLEPASFELLTFEQERNEALIERLTEAADVFWARHMAGDLAPPLPDPDDRRCQECEFRRTCRGAASTWQQPRPEVAPAAAVDEGLADVVADYLAAKAGVESAEGVLDLVARALKDALGKRECVEVPSLGARITYAARPGGMAWDTKYLDKHHPELRETCLKPKAGSRPLLVNVRNRQ